MYCTDNNISKQTYTVVKMILDQILCIVVRPNSALLEYLRSLLCWFIFYLYIKYYILCWWSKRYMMYNLHYACKQHSNTVE